MKRPYLQPESELLFLRSASVIATSNPFNWGEGKEDEFVEEGEYQWDEFEEDQENNEMGLGDYDHFHRRMWRDEDDNSTH